METMMSVTTETQRIFCLFDKKIRIVHCTVVPGGSITAELRGKYPWECVHQDWHDVVKDKFELCSSSKSSQFYVARLSGGVAFSEGQKACSWLWSVEAINPSCSNCCVAIACNTILVPTGLDKLSQQERNIMTNLGWGKSPKDIAGELGLSVSTINTQLRRARQKLDLKDLLQVAVWAAVYRDVLSLERDLFRDKLSKKKGVQRVK
jgi:DNA-binding CsgD family transcriptional regulator